VKEIGEKCCIHAHTNSPRQSQPRFVPPHVFFITSLLSREFSSPPHPRVASIHISESITSESPDPKTQPKVSTDSMGGFCICLILQLLLGLGDLKSITQRERQKVLQSCTHRTAQPIPFPFRYTPTAHIATRFIHPRKARFNSSTSNGHLDPYRLQVYHV